MAVGAGVAVGVGVAVGAGVGVIVGVGVGVEVGALVGVGVGVAVGAGVGVGVAVAAGVGVGVGVDVGIGTGVGVGAEFLEKFHPVLPLPDPFCLTQVSDWYLNAISFSLYEFAFEPIAINANAFLVRKMGYCPLTPIT